MKKIKIQWTAGRIVKLAMVALIVLFIVLSAVASFSDKKKSGDKPRGNGMGAGGNQAVSLITVSVKEMQNETIQNTVKLTGNVSSVSEINIYPDTSGKITKIEKKLGDSVQRGERIAYIDPSKPGSSYVASPVVATVSGTIIDLPISLGDTVSSSTTIATVGSLTDLQLKVYAAEKYSDYLKEGMKAYVSLTSVSGEKFEATAVKISPVVEKTTRTIECDLRFSKYDARIKPGMFATVELVIQEKNDTFVLPKTCISNYNGKDTVLVLDSENIARRTEIKTGIGNDFDVAVESGLKKGDLVITGGSATDGSKVRIAGDNSDNSMENSMENFGENPKENNAEMAPGGEQKAPNGKIASGDEQNNNIDSVKGKSKDKKAKSKASDEKSKAPDGEGR